jgi:hypothetical protein
MSSWSSRAHPELECLLDVARQRFGQRCSTHATTQRQLARTRARLLRGPRRGLAAWRSLARPELECLRDVARQRFGQDIRRVVR